VKARPRRSPQAADVRTVGEIIRAVRRARGESQRAFAARLGVAQPRVTEWETDRVMPAADTLLEVLALAPFGVLYGLVGAYVANRGSAAPDGD